MHLDIPNLSDDLKQNILKIGGSWNFFSVLHIYRFICETVRAESLLLGIFQ